MSSNDDAKALIAAGGDEGKNVDKIREILFGTQMRDYDSRFSKLEERVMRDTDRLREDLKRRFDTLESFIKGEVESLTQRLKSEKAERLEALKELTRELKDATKALDKKLAQLEEEMNGGHSELRNRLLEQSKSLTAEIEQKHGELSEALDREAQLLRVEKTDRAMLGDLFSEVGLRLKNQLKLPEK